MSRDDSRTSCDGSGVIVSGRVARFRVRWIGEIPEGFGADATAAHVLVGG